MGKIALILLLGSLWMHADLQQVCLSCHQQHQIPSNLIYKRYLLKYSTKERIQKAIYRYLKHPTQSTSIMPAPFFLKFPMKQPVTVPDEVLRENIREFVKRFDPRQRLVLEE